MKDHEMIFSMTLDHPPGPLLDLDDAVRRALIELEACAVARRVHADRVRSRWQGRRRADFDAAAADLEGSVRRVLADLRSLRKITAGVTAADR